MQKDNVVLYPAVLLLALNLAQKEWVQLWSPSPVQRYFSDRQFTEVKPPGNMLCARAGVSDTIKYYS